MIRLTALITCLTLLAACGVDGEPERPERPEQRSGTTVSGQVGVGISGGS